MFYFELSILRGIQSNFSVFYEIYKYAVNKKIFCNIINMAYDKKTNDFLSQGSVKK